MFFQGQEWSASAPFHYFVDFAGELARLVREGRWQEMRRFQRSRGREQVTPLLDATDRGTFDACILDWSERDAPSHQQALALHRDLLRLRRENQSFAAQDASAIEYSILGPEAFLLRYAGADDADRLVLVNLGRDLPLARTSEPLLAPPGGRHWTLTWSSDDPRYGGPGSLEIDPRDWIIPGHATNVLAAVESASS
jgi:maltooligosyltrehalose trehalohydrolase